MSMPRRIETLWAFIALDPEDNTEGIIADLSSPTMGPTPLIGADEARVKSLRPIAEAAARLGGYEVKLIRFDNRVVEEVIEP